MYTYIYAHAGCHHVITKCLHKYFEQQHIVVDPQTQAICKKASRVGAVVWLEKAWLQ